MTGRRTSRRLSSKINEIVDNVLEEKENGRRSSRNVANKPKSYVLVEEGEEETPENMVKPRRERALSSKAMENIALDVSDILEGESPVRKSARKRKSKKLDEAFIYESPGKGKRMANESVIVEESLEIEDAEKPEVLFAEEMDVDGGQLFGFKTPKKRDGMSLLAQNTPKTPQNVHTPKTSGNASAGRNTLKTPSHVRTKIKESKISRPTQSFLNLIVSFFSRTEQVISFG